VKEELRRLAVDPYEDWIPPSDLQDYNKDGCLGRWCLDKLSLWITSELSISQATRRHVVSHVNRLRDLHTQRVSWVWRSVKHRVVAHVIAFQYYTGHSGHF